MCLAAVSGAMNIQGHEYLSIPARTDRGLAAPWRAAAQSTGWAGKGWCFPVLQEPGLSARSWAADPPGGGGKYRKAGASSSLVS